MQAKGSCLAGVLIHFHLSRWSFWYYMFS